MAIKIKKSHEGLLHKDLGVKQGEKIPASKLKVKSTDSPAVKKRKIFAENASHWSKGEDGISVGNGDPKRKLNLKPILDQQTNKVQQPSNLISTPPQSANAINFTPNDNGTDLPAYTPPQGIINTNGTPAFRSDIGSNPPSKDPQWLQNAQNQYNNNQGIQKKFDKSLLGQNDDQYTKWYQDKWGTPNKFDVNKAEGYLEGGLWAADALIPAQRHNRYYDRPEDQLTYNQNAYGTGSQAMMKNGGKISKKGVKKMPNGGSDPSGSDLFNTNKSQYVDSVLNANKNLNWVQRLYPENTPSIQVPGEPYPSTHLMSDDGNGYVFPRVQMINGKLVDLGKQAEDYSRTNNTGIQLPKQQGTWFADNGYKEGKGVLPAAHYQTPIQDLPKKAPAKSAAQATKSAIFDMGGMMGGGAPGLSGSLYSIGNTSFPQSPSAKKKGRKKGEDGAQMTSPNLMDGITPHWGGNVEQISMNPYDGGTMKFNGDSHAEGGIGIQYGKKPIEVEGDETAFKDSQNNLNIMGNMKNPITGNKFKVDAKTIAGKEVKAQGLMDKGSNLLNTQDPTDKFERLSFNAGKIMATGGAMKQKELAASKEHMADIQNTMLDMANEKGINPDKLFKGKAKFGAKVAAKTSGEKMINGKLVKDLYPDGGSVDSTGTPTDTYAAGDPRLAFDKIKQKTIQDLQAKYPGKKVDVVYNDLGKTRTRGQQLDISTAKGSISPTFSMHNIDAARDYTIIVDGKEQNSSSSDYNILHKNASDMGLYPLRGNAGQKDPYHIGLVQEGGPNTAANFYEKFPQAKSWSQDKDYFNQLEPIVQSGQATPAELKAYRAYTGQNANYSTSAAQPTGALYVPPGKTLVGEDLQTTSTQGPIDNPLTALTPDEQSRMDGWQPTYNPETVTPGNEQFDFTNPRVINKKSNAQPLELSEIAGEAYTLASNKVQPVQMQKYSPSLYEPYQVSFQDQINQNNSQFNNIQKQLAYDPTALSSLAGQQYSANNSVKASEFRTNQEINNDIINKNVNLSNDAQLKNLQLGDTQYTRQTDTIANTKMFNRDALDSISSKLLQRKADNNTLKVYENLYPYYQFDPNSYKSQYVGPNASEALFNPDGSPISSGLTNNGQSGDDRTTVYRDAQGNIRSTKTSVPSATDQTKAGITINKGLRDLMKNPYPGNSTTDTPIARAFKLGR